MSDSKVCPSCGHANSFDARFCGRCGTALAPAAPVAPVAPEPVPSQPSARAMQKTMLGAMIDDLPKPAAPAAAPAPKPAAKQPMRTMLGGGFEGLADLVKAVEAGAPLPPDPASAAQPAVAQPAVAQPPMVAQPPAAQPPAAQPTPPAPFVPPAASSTAKLPLSPLATAPTPATEPSIPRRDAMRTMLGAGLEAPPVAQQPVAAPPIVQPPVAQPPVAQPAVAQPPVAAPPIAQPPVAAPPVAPPIAQPPVAQPPVAQLIAPEPPAPIAAPDAMPSPEIAHPTIAPNDLDESTVRETLGASAAPAGSTLEGMPAAAAPPTIEAPLPAAPAQQNRARTMLGMAAPVIGALPPQSAPEPVRPAISEPVAPAPAAPVDIAPAPAAAPASAALPKRALGPSNRTMLGVAAPRAGAAASAPSAPAPVVHAPAPAPMPQVALPAASSVSSTSELSIAGLPSPRRRARGAYIALLVLGVMLVGSVIVAALYYRMTRPRTDVVASVASAPTGEVLHVTVTSAPEGTHARFSGTDLALTNGGADFPLPAQALHVGDNAVSIDVVFADGSSETHQVTLTVEYRIHADLSTLSATPPAITVVIDAVPGSTVTLEGQPLALDAAGHGTRAISVAGLAPGADGMITHAAPYTIAPPTGPSAAGTLSTRVPVVSVTLERPRDAAITDRATVDVTGTVSPGATVTVDGAPAAVTAEGRFTATVALAQVGEREVVVSASAPGRVATSRTLHLRRVADLAREAAAFSVDRSLTYARIAATPDAFQGQHVAIEGRVYNVDLQDGQGVLQLLARDCAAGERCPLWVTYSGVGDVAVESWVRVVGTVVGTQQFRSQSGEVRTVPRLDATFVLPARP